VDDGGLGRTRCGVWSIWILLGQLRLVTLERRGANVSNARLDIEDRGECGGYLVSNVYQPSVFGMSVCLLRQRES
jgi:hypothetical protein